MNMLWISSDVPFDKMHGRTIDISTRIQVVAEAGINVHLVCFSKGAVSNEGLEKLEKYCSSVNIIKRPKKYPYILHPSCPYSVLTRYANNLSDIIGSILKQSNIDIACLEQPQVGKVIPFLNGANIPIVLRLHNIESFYFKELAKDYNNPFTKIIYCWESYKLAKYEKYVYNNCQAIFCVSLEEANKLKQLYPELHVTWLPVPVKLNVPDIKVNGTKPIIAFSGSMYLPNNIRAVTWFAHEVFPKVLEAVPDAEFWIIGWKPAKSVQKLGYIKNIRVTGEVSNVHQLLLDASVVIAPLFHGAGVKVKVLEAIGLGKLVIASHSAVEGTGLINGRHVLVSDQPDMFAKWCVEALQDPNAFIEIRQEALRYFKEYHQPEVVGRRFLKELANVLDCER